MISGVKILNNECSTINLLERLQVNNGVAIAEGFDIYNKRSYKENAYKPIQAWSSLNTEQYELLYSNDERISVFENIGIVKIPDILIQLIDKIGFPTCKNDSDFFKLFEEKSDLLQELTLGIGNFFGDMMLDGYSIGDAKMHCVSYENAGIETIAYSPNDNKYFGLHIDSSKELNKLTTRNKNKNRLSINLGSEPRHLLFINQTVNGIIDLISEKDNSIIGQIDNFDEHELVSMFFKYYPNYPVLKLQQNPYEAYIAPTDNIIHDGCTIGKTYPDITIVFTGYFKLHYLPALS